MKLKSLLLALFVMVSGVASAQVVSGKVYRIVSAKYKTVITASPISNALSCVSVGTGTDYQQMWKFVDEGDGKYSIMNVFSGRYLQNETTNNVQFRTGTEKVTFAITENPTLRTYYNIGAGVGNRGLHCASGGTVVPWTFGPDDDGISGSEWTFTAVSISDEEMAKAAEEYAVYNAINSNKAEIVAKINNLFEDGAGTVLKAEYASKSDDELRAEMEGVPADLQDAVIKVKNNSWATCERERVSEKSFRVYEYYPYSNPEAWANILYTRPFNRINNPTGICTESDKDFVYVFVDEIPEGTEVWLAEMLGTYFWGNDTQLVEGLNVVPAANKDGILYIRYICDTHTGKKLADGSGVDLTKGKKLADYPRLKVHIEGGYVNGFWSKERGHDNADWEYMCENMFRNEGAVQAVGDHSVLDFRKKEFLAACPTEITELMVMWDFWNKRQKHYMNLDKYADYHNNKQLAMSDDNGFMDASSYRTHYNNYTLREITNVNILATDAGQSWGPNHEIGHTNQYAFEIVGTSEVSNNALTNFVIFDIGTHTSRGNNMQNQILDFENKVPYVERGEGYRGTKLFSMTRMYFQLFLYFHAVGHDKEFYPKLFERLRYDRLVGWSTHAQDGTVNPETGWEYGAMDATYDQLKFAEICCEIANMDLTEFFEAWGFFIPMNGSLVGDYGHHRVYLSQESIDACKARIAAKNYPKKGGHLMFLEDRVKKSPLMTNPELDEKINLSERIKGLENIKDGYRDNYANWDGEMIGTVGLYGQWHDYMDESVKAQDYYYSVSNGVVTIVKGKNAKGALGFKMYNKNTGELLTYTNKESMRVPVGVASTNVRVVAAQADGTDYEVRPAAEGPEDMQLDALELALKAAKKLLDISKEKSSEIGFIYKDSALVLEQIYNSAKVAYDEKKSPYEGKSYADWAVELTNEAGRLAQNEDARVRFEEGTTAEFQSDGNGYGYMTWSTGGALIAASSMDKEMSRWQLEYSGIPGEYFLKCVIGGDSYYIRESTEDYVYADLKNNTVNAERFTVGYAENGDVYFVSAVDGRALSIENGKIARQTPNTKSMWFGTIIKNNAAEFYKAELEAALLTARCIISEVVNIDSLKTMNMFNKNVFVFDRNLESYATDLCNRYVMASADIDNPKTHKAHLEAFRNLFYRIDGTYTVTSPLASKEGKTVLYYLRNVADDKYLGLYSGTTASKKNRLQAINVNKVDDTSLWSFTSTGKVDEYNMYNYGNGGYIYLNSSKLYAMPGECMPVTVKFNSEKGGVIISLDGEAFDVAGSNVDLIKEKYCESFWALEIATIEGEDDILGDLAADIEDVLPEAENGDIYDLSGRKVTNPTRGIYIQNGVKVFIK